MKKSPEQRPHTSRPNGSSSWRPWTTRQTPPSCGERLRQLMASLHQRQRMKLSFSTRSLPHHRKTLPTNSTNSSPHQSWAYTPLHTRLGMCQGKQDRSHRRRHRHSPQQWLLAQLRAAATAEPSDLICSASST